MAAPEPFLPGDLLPALSLPDASGAPFDLHHQSIAGLHRLLILGQAPAPDALRRAEAAASERQARIILVSQDRPAKAGLTEEPTRLIDADRKLFLGLGLPQGGVAVISPRGRLRFAQAGAAALQAALAILPEPEAPAIRRGGAPVLLIPDVLEPEMIAALLAHWEEGEKLQGRVAAAGADAGLVTDIKRRTDVFLTDRMLYAAFQRRLERRVLPEMWRAFRFRAASFEAPRIGCYSAETAGGFGAHRDNRTPFTAHRRFAMSLNLNSGAYSGGTLRFPEFGDEAYEPAAGGCAIFCCDLLHEALPVTEGQRFAIFTFFTDAEGAQQERRLMAEAAARGQKGVELR
ncbi:2OG-Fe(II) oxygenase family protein [Falsiroseomonas tokyonensis]|uniref:2OG-Fe(II) oxygenase family protein n=1 Tax=Falsiroseomonas tokyonensis TaxID=430521 RepID=A0ABV7BV58_9PROT|nr:2OG-Fe(II) oxygenase [Falsiroseomonas tokyonensis]MBU8539545.1 2OG-Fe(II) oxygenase [Falsiroseomonas tokyonensis]